VAIPYLSHFKSRVLYGSTGVDKSKKFDFEAEIQNIINHLN
jgi:hypothetical protein